MKKFGFLSSEKYRHRTKLVATIVFLFFLIKGLLWLIIPALFIYFGFGFDWW